MGVKAIKAKYNIGHIVAKHGENIHIGSSYINDIIVISPEGKIIKAYKDRKYDDGWSTDVDLKRYQEEMFSDLKELKRLFHLKDEFEQLHPVFTYKQGRIVKTSCEKYGWPNTTVDGELMYNNTFFPTYKKAYEALLANTKLKYDWTMFKDRVRDASNVFGRATKRLLSAVRFYVYARTIQYVIGILKN